MGLIAKTLELNFSIAAVSRYHLEMFFFYACQIDVDSEALWDQRVLRSRSFYVLCRCNLLSAPSPVPLLQPSTHVHSTAGATFNLVTPHNGSVFLLFTTHPEQKPDAQFCSSEHFKNSPLKSEFNGEGGIIPNSHSALLSGWSLVEQNLLSSGSIINTLDHYLRTWQRCNTAT